MKKHNFYAGPSILPEYTIQKTAEAILNFAGTTLSVLEISHRSKEFTKLPESRNNGGPISLRPILSCVLQSLVTFMRI